VDITFVDPANITPNQMNNGNQYLANDLIDRSELEIGNHPLKRRTSNIE
jgi:hypothetical protein